MSIVDIGKPIAKELVAFLTDSRGLASTDAPAPSVTTTHDASMSPPLDG
ncbi:hypothetical protein [Paractinoplanes ferrugineus]|nr:hypothetical protein [Actinoplanes ferrugineus]